MGQALYRKYRSKSLKDVVGQEHVTKTLEQALKQQRISHAYLFTGPRGIGKTSVARILAHEINNLPYTDDASHIDIIEIDAASNRRIDEIRELRDKVHIAPTSAKYKVYIIDEVHMLTREAFNALLKTLEEPPEHVVFILATTDVHKLPETIVSRTQRFHFKPAEVSDLTTLLQKVAKAEKITITPEGLALLAEHSDGSFRDGLSLLDQARSHSDVVDAKAIQELLGLPPAEAVQAVLTAVMNGDGSSVVQKLTELYNQGFQAATIAKHLGQLLRANIVERSSDNDRPMKLELLGSLVEVPPAYDPERYLEIVLLKAASEQPQQVPTETAVPVKQTKEVIEEPTQKPVKSPLEKAEQHPASNKPVSNEDLWPALLTALKQKHNTLYGIVRMAKPSFPAENTLQLTFTFAFHQKRLNETVNRQLLLDTVEKLTGRQLIIEYTLDKDGAPTQPSAKITPAPPDDGLSTINNIFSGAELLES
jgi:DNA polymerase-3 subunit gamma/tau